MPTFWTGSCRTVRLVSRNPSAQHSMGYWSSGLPAQHQAACRADPKVLRWLSPSCRWFFVVFLPSTWTGVCSSVLLKTVESCCNEIRRFMIANKLKLASLAFSRADREIYDCKQVGSPNRFWKSIADYHTLYICIDLFFKIWFQWYQFYVDHLSSSKVKIFLYLIFCPQNAN